MPLNYIRRRSHFIWMGLTALFFYLGWWPLGLVSLVLYAALVALARKRPTTFHDEQVLGQGLVFSPVTAAVSSIRSHVNHPVFGPDQIEIELKLPFWKEWGLFFPASAEVIDTIGKKQDVYVTLLRPDGRRLGLELSGRRFWGGVSLNLLPGDRGRSAAPFGHLSFGGRVLLYLTENCEILVQVNEQVVAGQTALAAEV